MRFSQALLYNCQLIRFNIYMYHPDVANGDIYIYTLCTQTENAVVSLCICAVLFEDWLFDVAV